MEGTELILKETNTTSRTKKTEQLTFNLSQSRVQHFTTNITSMRRYPNNYLTCVSVTVRCISGQTLEVVNSSLLTAAVWSELCRAPRNNVLFADSVITHDLGRRPCCLLLFYDSLIWEPATRFVKMSTCEQTVWRRTLSPVGNKTSSEVFAAKHLSAVCYSAVRLMLQKCRPANKTDICKQKWYVTSA